ncbi:hypothetical protein H4582DRAFT_2063546 [Lactarius indigo]|nr:hypothetical protein H4582DRAFT_2065539 [Lactarius indigo]KAI9430646.1 hypothetical protein H4582DRAFT_2063546 [Lactarius indigo]
MIIRHMRSWWLACTLMLCCRECLMRIGGDGDMIARVTCGQCRGIGSAISNGSEGRHGCDLCHHSVTVGMSVGTVTGRCDGAGVVPGVNDGGQVELFSKEIKNWKCSCQDPVDVHVPRDEAANIDSIALEGCQWQSNKLTLYHVLQVQHGDSEGSLDKMLDARPLTGELTSMVRLEKRTGVSMVIKKEINRRRFKKYRDVVGKEEHECIYASIISWYFSSSACSGRSIWPEDGAGDGLRGTVNGKSGSFPKSTLSYQESRSLQCVAGKLRIAHLWQLKHCPHGMWLGPNVLSEKDWSGLHTYVSYIIKLAKEDTRSKHSLLTRVAAIAIIPGVAKLTPQITPFVKRFAVASPSIDEGHKK